MRIDDLENLKLCLDTGDINFFHGDLAEAFKEVVDELSEIKGVNLLGDFESVEDMANECEILAGEKEEFLESRVETLKECKVTYDLDKDLYTLKSPDNHAKLTLESYDISEHLEYEVIVRVVR